MYQPGFAVYITLGLTIRQTPTMRIFITALALAVAASTAQASATCGAEAVRELAARNVDGLIKNFDASNSQTRKDLEDIIAKLGELSDISEVVQPRFSSHTRLTVAASNLSPEYKATVHRINATSSKMGAIQVSVEAKPNVPCKLLAVQIDIGSR